MGRKKLGPEMDKIGKRTSSLSGEKLFSVMYSEFLSEMSSSEQEAYREDTIRAVPAFRKWIENKPDAEVAKLF